MSAYIKELQAKVAAAQAEAEARRAEQDRVNQQAARHRLTPLEDRLSRLLATIPLSIQREGVSLPTLQASLRGRWRGNVHPGELGTALRKLGFARERRWRDGAGFQALWYLIRRE
jgi:hypothetical protein